MGSQEWLIQWFRKVLKILTKTKTSSANEAHFRTKFWVCLNWIISTLTIKYQMFQWPNVLATWLLTLSINQSVIKSVLYFKALRAFWWCWKKFCCFALNFFRPLTVFCQQRVIVFIVIFIVFGVVLIFSFNQEKFPLSLVRPKQIDSLVLSELWVHFKLRSCEHPNSKSSKEEMKYI